MNDFDETIKTKPKIQILTEVILEIIEKQNRIVQRISKRSYNTRSQKKTKPNFRKKEFTKKQLNHCKKPLKI